MPKYLVVGKEDNGYPTDADSVDALLQDLDEEELKDIECIYELTDVTPSNINVSTEQAHPDYVGEKPLPAHWLKPVLPQS